TLCPYTTLFRSFFINSKREYKVQCVQSMCKCEKKCNCCLYSHCVCSGYGMLEDRSSFSVSLFLSCSSRDVCLTSVFRKVHGQDVRSLLQYFGPWYVVFSCRSVGRGALMMW